MRMIKVSVKSRLGGKRVRMGVVISLNDEEVVAPNLNDVIMFKTCEKLKDEFKGTIPNGFLGHLEMVSIKDI